MKVEDFEVDINGSEIHFKGNLNLKGYGTKLPFTKEHIEEYIKCAKDWKYFAEKYYHILDLQKGMIIPTLRDYQVKMIDSFSKRRFTITLASRQCG